MSSRAHRPSYSEADAAPLTIDVWSDVACPWCYIGKRRLEAALEQFGADETPLVVRFRSFQLDPTTPVDFAGSAVEYLAGYKGIPEPQARQMHRQVSQIAADVGLKYDFENQKVANTLKAHQLLQFAWDKGRQWETKEALLSAHFVEGRHVGRDEELVTIAQEVGLDGLEFEQALKQEEYLPAVREDQSLATRLGIHGVPFFVFDGRLAVSGAQREEVFVAALTRAQRERDGSVDDRG